MSQCHDLYDMVAPARPRPARPTVATHCHDEYPASGPDDDEPAPPPEPARLLQQV